MLCLLLLKSNEEKLENGESPFGETFCGKENFKPLHMTSFSKNDKRYEEIFLICSSTSNFFEIRRPILSQWVRIKSFYKALHEADKTCVAAT